MPYFTQTDLENALGVQVVKAIFDDDHDGTADAAPIAACIAYAAAECNSFLRGKYDITLPPATVPDELKFAAIDFGCAYAVRRRSDVTSSMGMEKWTTFQESAVAKMKRYAETLQMLPATTGTPSNVGATVGSPVSVTNADGDTRHSVWEDIGKYF